MTAGLIAGAVELAAGFFRDSCTAAGFEPVPETEADPFSFVRLSADESALPGLVAAPPEPGAFEMAAPVAGAPDCCGASLAFGVLGAAAAPAGGVPLVPGTGNTLAFGNPCWTCGKALGARFAGCVKPGADFCPAAVPGAAGLIEALGGIGSLPCWISDAFCATAGGSVAVAAAPPFPSDGTPPAAGCGD